MSEPQLRKLAETALVENYPRGIEVFAEGQPATSFLLVLSGAVKVYILSPDGREQILHLARPGDLVAEGAALANQAYPASATTTEPSTIARFHREVLVDLIRRDPELALAMIAGLSQRLREFVVTIGDLSLRDVTTRLARYLLDNAVGNVCPLPGTKTQLAAQLGTVLEPLSRSFRRLKDEGIITQRGRNIVILKPEALRGIVEGMDLGTADGRET